MMELLTLKEGDDYFKIEGNLFHRCMMSKATVYPLSQLDEAKKTLELLQRHDINARLLKLTITEEEFVEK